MSASFVVGDEVRLKSGGPKMTVMWLPDAEYNSGYGCAWFASDNERTTDSFPEQSIELVSEK